VGQVENQEVPCSSNYCYRVLSLVVAIEGSSLDVVVIDNKYIDFRYDGRGGKETKVALSLFL
jgi:hypothetical protein